jgi:hypothetical protein
MEKLRDKLIKIPANRKIGKYLRRRPFQSEPEIDQIHKIRHKSDTIHQVKVKIYNRLVNLVIPEFKRDAEEKENRQVNDENCRNIEPETNQKQPHQFAGAQGGEVMKIKEVKADPGKKKEQQNYQ